MTVAIAAVAGFLAGRLLWLLARPTLTTPLFERENHRGVPVPTAAGIVLPLAVLAVEGVRAVGGDGLSAPRLATVVVATGMGVFGLLDDLAGTGDARGFRGHVLSLLRGRLTTGGAKLVGGAAVALVAVAPFAGEGERVERLVADAALVALAANLGNLFDRAPGRAGKVGLVSFVALVVAVRADTDLTGPAVVVGAAAALLLDDLHERLMLGDTGANVLGGVVGLGVVATCAPSTRTTALVVLVALNLLSEAVSFSRAIDAIPPLRALDRAGRRTR